MSELDEDASLFNYVPDMFKTADEKNIKKHFDFHGMPEELRTIDFYMEAVKHDTDLFWHIPDKFRTTEICFEVIKESGWVFKELLERSFSSQNVVDIINRLTLKFIGRPFSFLRRLGVTYLLNLVKHESPQTIALILIYLESYKASYLLKNLPSSVQIEVIRYIATDMNLEMFEQALKNKLSTLSSENNANSDDMKYIAAIFELADRASEEQVINVLKNEEPEFYEEIRKCLFTFNDIVFLDNKYIIKVLHEVDSNDLIRSLKGAGVEVQNKIFGSMSKVSFCMLKEEIEYEGKVRIKDINRARKNIVSIIRRLEDCGEIVCSNTNAIINDKPCKDDIGISGLERAVKILKLIELDMEEQIINGLQDQFPELTENLKKQIFSFDDIVLLNDKYIQKILREVDSQEFAKSLKSAGTDLKDRIFNNMSRRAVSILKKEIVSMKRLSETDIRKAQRKIVSVVRHLNVTGEIIIFDSDDVME